MARVLVPLAVCAALVPVVWLELEAGSESAGRVVGTLALALAPALALLLTRRLLVALPALVLAGIGAASLAFGVPLTDMGPGDEQGFFGPVGAAMADGFRDVYEARAPFGRDDFPELAGLVLLAIFLGVAVCSLLAMRGRVIPLAFALVVAVGVPATVAAKSGVGQPLRTGALAARRAPAHVLRHPGRRSHRSRGAGGRGPGRRAGRGGDRGVDLGGGGQARVRRVAAVGSVRPARRPGRRPLRVGVELRRDHVPGEADGGATGAVVQAAAVLARDDARRVHGCRLAREPAARCARARARARGRGRRPARARRPR